MALTIEITSDFICPWCLIAHHHLQQAIEQLEQLADQPIDIRWHPFELNPDMPEAGLDRRLYRSTKFGSWEYSQQLDAKTVEAGRANGIEFRYALMEKTPNTLKAHRLTGLAAKSGKATEMAERILQAYFTGLNSCFGEVAKFKMSRVVSEHKALRQSTYANAF